MLKKSKGEKKYFKRIFKKLIYCLYAIDKILFPINSKHSPNMLTIRWFVHTTAFLIWSVSCIIREVMRNRVYNLWTNHVINQKPCLSCRYLLLLLSLISCILFFCFLSRIFNFWLKLVIKYDIREISQINTTTKKHQSFFAYNTSRAHSLFTLKIKFAITSSYILIAY